MGVFLPISRLLYEGHEEFSVLPTFGVLPALKACFEQVQEGLPGINIDLSMVWLTIFQEIIVKSSNLTVAWFLCGLSSN